MEAKTWEDTVVDLSETTNESLRILMTKILQSQAEISFKAGQEDVILESKMGTLTVSSLVKKGRQEVVEWLKEHPRIIDELRDVLPNKLKDWGI